MSASPVPAQCVTAALLWSYLAKAMAAAAAWMQNRLCCTPCGGFILDIRTVFGIHERSSTTPNLSAALMGIRERPSAKAPSIKAVAAAEGPAS